MSDNQLVESIQDKYETLLPYLNEKTRRIWAAIEARSLGWGGVSQVAIATGLSRTTIHAGMRLLSEQTGANLNGTNLQRADLNGTNLEGANLNYANLEEAKLSDAKYTNKNTTAKTCKLFTKKYPCPTIFPKGFDPKDAKMMLIK